MPLTGKQLRRPPCTTYNYAYDGEGSRVGTTENGQTTVLAYDAFGNLAAEYGQSGLAMCGTATCYLFDDGSFGVDADVDR